MPRSILVRSSTGGWHTNLHKGRPANPRDRPLRRPHPPDVRPRRDRPFRRWWLASGLGAVAVGWVAVTGVQAPDLPLIANYGPDLARAHVPIGQGLANANVPPAARTLAVNDAGAMPYYSRWTTIDIIGLNDEAIAHRTEDPNTRVIDARPTVIVVRSYDPN